MQSCRDAFVKTTDLEALGQSSDYIRLRLHFFRFWCERSCFSGISIVSLRFSA